jgi:hypothetical protein
MHHDTLPCCRVLSKTKPKPKNQKPKRTEGELCLEDGVAEDEKEDNIRNEEGATAVLIHEVGKAPDVALHPHMATDGAQQYGSHCAP